MIYTTPNKIYTLEEYLELDFKTDAKKLKSLECEMSVGEIYQRIIFES